MRNWWEEDEVIQPAGQPMPRGYQISPPKPKEAPAGYRYDANGNLQAIPGGPADPARDKPNLPQGWRMGASGVAEPIPGLPPAKDENRLTAEQRGKLDAQLSGAIDLAKRIGEIELRYNRDLRGAAGQGDSPGAASLLEYSPWREANQSFDDAGKSLIGDLAAAYGLSGQQQNTPAELEIRFGPFLPRAGEQDARIEAKIARLREIAEQKRAEAERQLGITRENERNPAALPPGAANPSGGSGQGGNGTFGPQMGLTQGETRFETDPTLAGVNARIADMVGRGASADQVRAYWRSLAGKDADLNGLDQWVDFIKKNPGYRGPIGVSVEQREVPMSEGQQFFNSVAQSAPGAAVIGAADSISLGTLDNWTDNPALARAGMAGVREQHPYTTLAGNIGGGALAAAGAELAAARAGLAGVRGMIAGDAAYGAAYGAGSADEGSRLLGAATGAGVGVVGGQIGRGVVNAGGRVIAGARDAATRRLTEAGVPLTVGQIAGRGGVVGRTVKGLEDKLESIPLLGDAIRARRTEGFQAFNQRAFDEALETVGPRASREIGEEGVDAAKAQIGDAYDQALNGARVALDKSFAADMTRIAAIAKRLHPEIRGDFVNIVREEIAPIAAAGGFTGREFQAIRRVIRKEKAAWENAPRGHRYGKALDQLETSLEMLVRRQAPDAVPALNAADAAYRKMMVVENAVGRGINAGGVFTPAQLGTSAKQAGQNYGGRGASTRRDFFDLQRAGQEVLPSQVPNSGTADRLAAAAVLPILPAAVGGAGYSAGLLSPENAGLFASLGLPFTKTGAAALQKLLVERPEIMQRYGQKILDNGRRGGMFGNAGGRVGVGSGLALLPGY